MAIRSLPAYSNEYPERCESDEAGSDPGFYRRHELRCQRGVGCGWHLAMPSLHLYPDSDNVDSLFEAEADIVHD